jgi:hypothetical protein
VYTDKYEMALLKHAKRLEGEGEMAHKKEK